MNKLEFQQKISASNRPVIIDFWAPWCGPCMMTKPILEKLAKEYEGRVKGRWARQYIYFQFENRQMILQLFSPLRI